MEEENENQMPVVIFLKCHFVVHTMAMETRKMDLIDQITL